MTLSRFLRDYLYIPLGGNRQGPVRRYVNLSSRCCSAASGTARAGRSCLGRVARRVSAINHLWRTVFGELSARARARRQNSVRCVTDLPGGERRMGLSPRARRRDRPAGVGRNVRPLRRRFFPARRTTWIRAALRRALESICVDTFLGGGRQFVMTYLWVLFACVIAFLAPNSQQIPHRRFRPALPSQPPASNAPMRCACASTGAGPTGLGLLAGLSLLSLSSPTEFLYFQF